MRLTRLLSALLLLAPTGAASTAATGDWELQVREIERLSTTAPWQQSTAKIEELAPHIGDLSLDQRQRVEYVRLRNLGLAGKNTDALEGFSALLRQDMSPSLRVNIATTAVSMAANAEDWALAFKWLNAAMSYLPEASQESTRLFGAASYLYTLVGETGRARDLALRQIAGIDGEKDPLALCRAFGSAALAEEHADNFREAEAWRRRQITTCIRAHDPVFTANGKYGVGKALAKHGHHVEALRWAEEALNEFDAVGFVLGAYSTRLLIADNLLALNRDLPRVETLLTNALQYFQQQNSTVAIAETEELLARLAEARNQPQNAVAHLKRAMRGRAEVERSARERRLAYQQIQFDTQHKEQQIALLQTEKALAEAQATSVTRRQLLFLVGLTGLLAAAALLAVLLRRVARERRRYRWQSEHDSLTRLYNYQHVRKLGQAAFARARASGKPFTAVAIDIDLFKQVNDVHGHAAGDEALRCLGDWISEVIGNDGIAGRSGGDEFTVLLNTDAAQADVLLRSLRRRIGPISVFGHTFGFNISAGVCQADGETTTIAQLIHQADQALYRAKRDGRDRVVCTVSTPIPELASARGLVVVGSGIQFGRHASERCLSEIRVADVVFCLADPYALGMITTLRPDTINLGVHYAIGKDRRETYREIDAAIMSAVRAGKNVCAVFYGHPGVFADVPHAVIRKARAEGFSARMEPGISAEACLYADLGLDPGRHGVQSIEATHFLARDRQLDPANLVLLWQVALAGDLSCTRFHAEAEGLQALADKLLRWYPPRHEVILYEAAQVPIESPRAEHLALCDLPTAQYKEYTTLVIPPCVDIAAIDTDKELTGDDAATAAHQAAV